MKIITLKTLFVFLLLTSIVYSDETLNLPESKGSGMDEAMMAAWQEYATPAEGHDFLKNLIGNWTYTMKYWATEGADAEESDGSSNAQWIMNGKFLEENISGTSMGQPFTGKNIMGYNNGTDKYTSYWFDSMSTGSMFAEGAIDFEGKTASTSGNYHCPMRGKNTDYRSIIKIIDDNTRTYEMYMTEDDGTEFLAMQIDYTRDQ